MSEGSTSLTGNGQIGIDPSVFAPPVQDSEQDFTMDDLDWDQDDEDGKTEPSSGPVRGKSGYGMSAGNSSTGEGSSKGPIAAPVKSACTFCRSRKSRCNGKQPCMACINRQQPDDCHYTISRRGGKPKPKSAKVEPMEAHLDKIFELSDLPHLVRIPNAVPQLQGFMLDDEDGSTVLSTQPNLSLSPSFSNSRARSESIQLDNVPATRSLLKGFYTLFYRFIPIFPDETHLDQLASAIPADSPFLLALQCVLPIIRNEPLVPAPSANEEEKKAHIRTQSAFLAKKTESAIDTVLEKVENRTEEEDFHTLEVIQALCLLIIYEYGSGRALKARLKADTALGIAMSKGLHRLSASSTSSTGIRSPRVSNVGMPHFFSQVAAEEMYEVKKRMWWSLWSMTMWTAYNTGRIPTIRADDPRITSELPQCKDGKAWAYNISSLQGLLLVQDRVLALSNLENGRGHSIESLAPSSASLPSLPFQSSSTGRAVTPSSNEQGIPTSFSGHPTMASRQDILQSMLDIDGALQNQMKELEQITEGVIATKGNSYPFQGATSTVDDDTRYLHFVWAIQLYTASLTLHVGQAFQGATLFERKLCFLSSISESNDAAACQVPMPNAFSDELFSFSPMSMSIAPEQDLYARGPFLPQDSLRRCVDASDKLLEISRNLRQLKGPFAAPNNPFNACSFVLISFVCLMQALAISTNVMDDGDWQTALTPSDAHGNAPTILKSAQGAAALNPSSQSTPASSTIARQYQLQHIWGRVKEAKGTLRELARHWDMVIPMAEEVGGCLEASQFLLSHQELGSTASSLNFPGAAM